MPQDAEDILVPSLGALQASIAVLLTIFVGVLGAQFKLLSESVPSSAAYYECWIAVAFGDCKLKHWTPFLRTSNTEQALRYVPILTWGLSYGILSILLGQVVTYFFRFPSWATPAITFNNTTSLPLILVQSLAATKLLDSIDSSGDAVARATSYFLVNSMVGDSLTFALGPKLLNGWRDDLPEEESEDEIDSHVEAQEEEAEHTNVESSLLPNGVVRAGTRAEYIAYKKGKHIWRRLPPWTQGMLNFLYQFVSPPVIGALLGALVGLVPALHRLFFNSQEEGGYLNAWLTSALHFAALKVVVTGVKLSDSLMRMKKGEQSGRVPLLLLVLITIIRFVIWPAISISVIYFSVTRTNLISNDPILWFAMMLMPMGPPALMLTALADVTGAGEEEKMSIAKFLTVRLLAVTINAQLRALTRTVDRIRHIANNISLGRWKPESR